MASATLSARQSCCTGAARCEASACVFPGKGRLRELALHQSAFRAGTPCRHLYQLSKGCIALCSYRADGHRSVVRIVRPGEILGWGDAFVSAIHRWEARTLTACSLWEVPATDWLAAHPGDAFAHILRLAYAESRQLERAVLQMSRLRMEDRLLAFLASFVAPGADFPAVAKVPILRCDIAEIIGTTPETCTRTLNQMRDRGLVTWPDAETVVIGTAAAQRLAEIGAQSLLDEAEAAFGTSAPALDLVRTGATSAMGRSLPRLAAAGRGARGGAADPVTDPMVTIP